MLKAVGKRVIVKEITEEKEGTKPLILQVNAKMPFKASVIAAGTEVDAQVELNDIVILPPHTGTPIEEDGVKYLVVYEDQILAVLDREATG
jgi:co-chaperonin GroES (HSP10)